MNKKRHTKILLQRKTGQIQNTRTPIQCRFITVSPRNPSRNPDWLAPSKTLGTYRTPGHPPGADSSPFPRGTPAETWTGWRRQRPWEPTGRPDAQDTRPVRILHRFPKEPRWRNPGPVGAVKDSGNQQDTRTPARCSFLTVSPRNPGRNPDRSAPTNLTPACPDAHASEDSPPFPQGTKAETRTTKTTTRWTGFQRRKNVDKKPQSVLEEI